jgi:hypothetical protein
MGKLENQTFIKIVGDNFNIIIQPPNSNGIQAILPHHFFNDLMVINQTCWVI